MITTFMRRCSSVTAHERAFENHANCGYDRPLDFLTNNKGASMADNTVRGRFVWHELITPNGAGAHEFYGKTIGWKKQGWEQDPSYQMFTASSGPLGATVEKRDAVPQWLAYVGTTDVDATV